MKELTAEERALVVRLHLEHNSISAIARQTGHDRGTIQRWCRRFLDDGDLRDLHRSGRPTAATPRLRAKVRRLHKAKKRISARAIARTLQARGEQCSRELVRRMLHADGLHPHVQPHGFMQVRGDKKRRLAWAADNKDRDWSNVWFGDEKRFVLHALPNRKNEVIWTDDR